MYTYPASTGIDACRYGWVAVHLMGNDFRISIFETIHDVCESFGNSDHLLIDMPIGLPENKWESSSRPEPMARQILKGRASTVFNAPCRQALETEEYPAANRINKKILAKGLSMQSFHISHKIKEVDRYLFRRPDLKNKLLESHPEVCFAKLNGGTPVYRNKKTPEGVAERLDILAANHSKTMEIAEAVEDDKTFKSVKDDVIDAFVLAVTGLYGVAEGLMTIPEQPGHDARGLIMQMVYHDGQREMEKQVKR